MSLAARHRDDPRPELSPLDGMTVAREHDAEVMAALQGRAAEEMMRRFAAGHRAYVAHVSGERAGFGWVATQSATIGELATAFEIPSGERYLWNFVTLPAHRGAGIYPRLLDAIVRAESAEAERFWVVCAPENRASGSGIRKAGFVEVADLSFDDEGKPALHPILPGGAEVAARLLGLREATSMLAPCWRCIRAGKLAEAACRSGHCCCDYQRPEIGCA